MPIVRIDIQAGKSTAYKRSILHGVRTAVTTALGVADDRVMQRIFEAQPEDIDATEVRSDRLTIVEVSMLAGRDADMKLDLYREIIRKLGFEPGIAEHDIVVIVNDPPAECFCVGGLSQGKHVDAPSSETAAEE